MGVVLAMVVLSIVWDYFRGRIREWSGVVVIGGVYAALNIGGYYLLNNVFGCEGSITQICITGSVVYCILTPLVVAIIYRVKSGN